MLSSPRTSPTRCAASRGIDHLTVRFEVCEFARLGHVGAFMG